MNPIHRKPLRTLLPPCVALLFVLLATAASAEPGSAAAQRRFERGQQLYRSGRYDDASAEFRKAFEIDPRPRYLYNAAQALRLAGDCRGAVALYEGFLRLAPDADARAAAARNLERCAVPEATPAAEASPPEAASDAPAPPPPAAEPAPIAPPAPAPPPVSLPGELSVVAIAPAPIAPLVATRGRVSPKWVGAIGGAVTGAALLTASILEGLGASQFDHLTRSCAPHCPSADVLPLQRQLDAATGLFVVSGVLAAATLVAVLITHAHVHR